MRILLYGSSPAMPTGMGKVAKETAAGLSRHGHDVHYFSPGDTGSHARPFPHDAPEEDRFTLHGTPNPGGPGISMFNVKLGEVDPDLVITNRNWQSLGWLANPLNNRYMNEAKPTPLLIYGPPIETEWEPPMFAEQILEEHLNEVWMVPFTELRYDQMLREWGLEQYLLPIEETGRWAPHGVDLDVFYPGCHDDHIDENAPGLHQGLGIGNRYVVLIIAENWRRKNLDLLFDAWGEFAGRVESHGGRRPLLMCHVDPYPTRGDDDFYGGWDLYKTAVSYDLTIAGNLAAVDDDTDTFTMKDHVGMFEPDEVIAAYLDAADCMVLPTSGEGFSMTSLEAMATGTPIVQTDLPHLRWLCGEAANYVRWDQQHALNTGERHVTPSVEHLTDVLEATWADEVMREEMGKMGRERATEFSLQNMTYRLAKAVEYVEEQL